MGIKNLVEKYNNRVELYNLVKRVDVTQKIFEPKEEVKEEFKPVNPPFQNQTTNNSDSIEELIDPILYDEPVISSPDMKDTKEPGFVSYVLLGVLIAVISLIFLYMICWMIPRQPTSFLTILLFVIVRIESP